MGGKVLLLRKDLAFMVGEHQIVAKKFVENSNIRPLDCRFEAVFKFVNQGHFGVWHSEPQNRIASAA